jgi:hypothetical protein
MEYSVKIIATTAGLTGKQGDNGNDHCMVERWGY